MQSSRLRKRQSTSMPGTPRDDKASCVFQWHVLIGSMCLSCVLSSGKAQCPCHFHPQLSRSSGKMKLSVISPTLNEAENIPTLIEQLQRTLGSVDYEILIVDDNSPDLTWSIA